MTGPVADPTRVLVKVKFLMPLDADSIEVETPRVPPATRWASPIATPWRGMWEAVWAQDRPPAEGCVITARAWSGSVTSNDVQIDWCALEAGSGSPDDF